MSKIIPWALYFAFVAAAVICGPHEQLLDFSGPVGAAKGVTAAVWVAFLSYSIWCSTRENIFRSLPKIGELHWGRQVGIDLYIGVAMFLALIWLNGGSWVVVALWAVPIVLFVNLATLVYLLIHFEQIVGRFAG